MEKFFELLKQTPLVDAAAAMGADGASNDIDEALEDGFFPPEAENHFVMKTAEDRAT